MQRGHRNRDVGVQGRSTAVRDHGWTEERHFPERFKQRGWAHVAVPRAIFLADETIAIFTDLDLGAMGVLLRHDVVSHNVSVG